MSQNFNLFRLQQLDSQLDKAHARMAEIEKMLQNDVELRSAQQHLQAELEKLNSLKAQLAKIEADTSNQQIKIELSESSLYGGKIKNPKELNDLEKEVASLKKHLLVLEERQLEAMFAVEEQLGVVQAAQDHLQNVENKIHQRNATCLGEKEMLSKDIQRLEREKQVTLESINPELLDKYQTIRNIKKGIAVVKVTQEKTCGACGTRLTLGMIQDSRSPDRLTYCPSCGRILYGG
jgi:predicted  nucleic acid-binding Zn-ribbon protein